MDVSLEDYIVDNNVNFQVQISNPNALAVRGQGGGRGRGQGGGRGRGQGGGRGRGQAGGRGRGMGRGGLQQRGGLFTSKTQKNQNHGQFVASHKPLSVTVNNNFDARDTIAKKKRPLDARSKLAAKAKLSDARTKIINLKGNRGGMVNKGQSHKGSDARAMILARKKAKQITPPGNGIGAGVVQSTSSTSLFRTVNQDVTSGNFQITRKVPGNQTGVQISGDSVLITRTLHDSQSESINSPLFTKTINNQQPNVRGPVIQLQNEMFQAHPRSQPMYSQVLTYDQDEEEDLWVGGYPSEKTLTVKMPQGHAQFTRPTQQKFQMNKITFGGERTVPKTPISPPTAIKRKAVGDTMSLMTGKQLRLGGAAPTAKQTRPITTVPRSVPQVVKQTKVMKQAPAPVVEEEFQEADPDMVLSPLQGYRILISNLHVIVTQDDIIELFGAIGPMKRARLVKPGTAEVVYVQREDALKAAQKYHNRELDGQSMQVKLVTPAKVPVKQATEVTTSPSQPAKEKGGPLKLGQNIKKNPGAGTVDLSTLHQALFKTQPSKQIKPVTFTVKI